jgi:hypothetical protein
MRKIYRNKNISISVGDNESVNFEVRFISDGNSGVTAINIPGDNDPEIHDSGTVNIGTGSVLKKGDKTIIVSDIINPVPEETDIIIEYYINTNLVHRHENLKSISDQPLIILWIKFN